MTADATEPLAQRYRKGIQATCAALAISASAGCGANYDTVVYQVGGTAEAVTIEYSGDEGWTHVGTAGADYAGDWPERIELSNPDDSPYIEVTNNDRDGGSATCRIYADDELVAAEQSSTFGSTFRCEA